MKRVLLALVVFAVLPVAPAGAQVACPLVHSASDHTVASTDGTPIAITAFRTGALDCGVDEVPVILTLHGWSGSRAREVDDVRGFLDEGYGVIGIDARGHGDSGGQALVHHPSREVNDFRAVMDWVYDNVPWIDREGFSFSKDFRVGAAGGSYGGGFQLMTAAFDRRLDAIVPVVTWNNLPQSLGPNGVARSDWLSLLYAAGKLSVDMDRRLDEWFVESMATNRPAPGFVQSFSESSPFYWMQNIVVPTLLVQGMPDTLFPLNEAVANFVGIRNNGAPAWLYGINTGHILPGLQPTGINAPSRDSTSGCGDIDALTNDFYAAFLKGDLAARARVNAFPRVSLPTEQGGCVSSGNWPVNTSQKEVTFPAVIIPQGAGTQLIPLHTATAETTIAGIPTLRASAPVELDDIFFLSLVLKDADGLHVVDDQVMAARTQLASVEGTYNVDLAGVATTMKPGDELYLRIDGANEQYVLNGNRRPGAAVLLDVKVGLPIA